MKSFICNQCNFEFNYADNATQIQCPNCGYIYTKNIDNSTKNVNINKPNEYPNKRRRSSTKKLSPIKLTIVILLIFIIFIYYKSCISWGTKLDCNITSDLEYTADTFESDLDNLDSYRSRSVTFNVKAIHPDAHFGYNLWSGEHLNFYPDNIEFYNDIIIGDNVKVYVNDVYKKFGDSYQIKCHIVDVQSTDTISEDTYTEQEDDEYILDDENSSFDSEGAEDTEDIEATVELYDLDKLKAEAKEFKESAISVTYDDLIHNPDLYECKNIKCEIKFTRTDPDGIIFDGTKLAKISGDSEEICVYDERLLSSPNFCEGDTIVVYGVGAGLGTMKSAGVSGVISDTWKGDKGYSIPCISVYYTDSDNYEDWVTVLNKRIEENGTDSEYTEKGKELADKLNSATSKINDSLEDSNN